MSAYKKVKFYDCTKIKHGDAFTGKVTKLYSVWDTMKQRCLNPNNKRYHRYGGRGITVCWEWLDYQTFKEWALNNGHQEHLTIDRIDNDKGYYPENCQFITRLENTMKRQHKLSWTKATAIRLLYNSTQKTQFELGKMFQVGAGNVGRVVRGETWVVR